MERWVLEGDSYSFLRSTPHTFNLQSREGPNHVEIFDITSIPNHHNAISETTCLCDIFGDDGESPSLSSSPASATFIKREVDPSFQVDDANDSLGSYHTANGSDLSDNAEVTYNTPSPENTPECSTYETRESDSPAAKSSISSDSKNGLYQLDCTPPASKGNSNELSHTDNSKESQVSANTAPVNETGFTNASEPQHVNSTPASTLVIQAKEPSNPTCPSEETEPAIFEQEGITTTPPQHISTSPFLDKQTFESDCESLTVSQFEQNDVMSSEDKESMIYCSPREQNIIFAHGTISNGSASELSTPSPTDCSLMQEMSTLNRDINFLPIPIVMTKPRPTSTSPVSRETTSTPASTGRSSPELLNLCPIQVRNTSETPNFDDTYGATLSVSTRPSSDNVEIDSLTASDISAENRGLVYSSTDGKERLESPEINETCSSPDYTAPVHSPEQVMNYSPVGCSIIPSPTFEKTCSSVEHEDPSSPLSPKNNETCYSLDPSTPARLPEQVMIHSPVGYTISPSPTKKRVVSSTEPEDSPSSPVSPEINETCSSSQHSASARLPVHVMIHSPVGYTISPSPTIERIVSSTEPEDFPSSPVSSEINESCSSPHYSASARTPEQEIIHSAIVYTISPSPTNERIVSSTEPEDCPSSPVSPEINETCPSSQHSASARSPDQEIIYSSVGYTISPSPTNERIVSSTELDNPSFPIDTRIEYRDICSSPDHSEPVIIHSPCYNINPSPTNERGVYSTEPDDSTSCSHSDIHSSFDHSIPALSPEPEIIHSPMGYTISPSPTNKRMFSAVEANDLPSSPAITGADYTEAPTYGGGSTPALRSITSTPNSRENYLTPEPNSPAPSQELRSVTCSPEIKTISYSVLPRNTKSPGITYNVTPTEELAQSPAEETNVYDNSSETSSYLSGKDTSVLPSSRNLLPTPESRSRPSSAASDQTKHTALSTELHPEPSVTFEKTENQNSSIVCEGVSHPFANPIDHLDCFNDHADTKTLKSLEFVSDKCKGSGPVQILQDSTSKTSDSGLPTIKIEKSQEIVTDSTTELAFCGTPTSLHPWDASMQKPVASVDKKHCRFEVFDRNNGTEMVQNYSPSSEKRLSQVSVALRESPGVIRRDSGGEFDKQPCREKEESGKKEGKGEETMGESSYRGEQVELSFSARNRKGPAGHSPALSSRDPKSGIPARCYFESHPTTLQQQSQLRAQGSQQENKGGARRLQSAAQGKYSSAGFLPPECTGEDSSMGSEFDEADNEVKWFTDLAFRSLSSPQVDYLDVYNSSHRSSTNVSQPSTVDSPGAIAWMTYADLRGSALHENDGSSFLPRDGLDPNKRFELGSFECVDVALESKEESSRGKRTVPKRQIQLLRRNTDESKPKGNHENILNSPSTYRRSKDAFVRQHSTPASVQEEVSKELPGSPQNDRKKTLQKSVSLDDGSPRTQMASCIIKSILSKKMQDVQKETEKGTDLIPFGDESKHPDISPSSLDVPSTIEKHSLSSSQHSECTLSSDTFAVEEERISHRQLKKCAPKVPPKPFLRPAFFNNGEAQLAGNIAREETKPVVAPPQAYDKIQNDKIDRKEEGGCNLEEKYNSDSANASISNTSPVVAKPAVSMQNRIKTRDIKKRQITPENQEQLVGKSVFMSKTPEITLKPSSIKAKKTSSLKVSLSPDLEQSREISESQTMEKAAEDINTKSAKVTTAENEDDSNKKTVIHKVRDVRKLVKNTYNLSFKASTSTSTAEETVIQEKREKPPQTPPALHIECKAISWKDKQTSSSKAIHCQDEKQPVDISKISQPWVCTETKRDADITEITSKGSSPKTETKQKTPYSQSTATDGLPELESINTRSYIDCDQSSKMPPRPSSKEREVSALVVLPDCTSKTKTVPPTTLDSSQMQAASSSHSVSMLLKEKGMQADIGVCDVLTDGASATAKHVNRLEVPVQACLSESISSEAQVKADKASLLCNPTTVNDSSRISQPSESPKGTQTEEPSTKEHEKKKTATTTMTQNPSYLATSGKSEVRSFSSSTKNNAMPVNASKEIELPIQVRSISTDRLKPFVQPKPSYKQSFAEIKPTDLSKADTQGSSVTKQQTMLSSEPKKNETPTVIHKDQTNETSSRDIKRLAVSAVSSCKPPSIPVTTTPSVVQKSTTKTLASLDQPQSSAFLQTTSTGLQQTPSFSQDQSMLDSSFASNSSGPQVLNRTPSLTRASSNNRFYTEDYLFYASDDPPSYDDRESFSPLRLSDLPPHRSCRYHPTTKQSSCSCTSSSHAQQGHPNNSPQERVPVASHSPGQVLTCPGAPPQAQVRPHQCRPDGLQVSNTTIPHASAMIQPLHNPRACPVSNSQSYGDDHPPASGLHADRRPANHPSPQAAGPASYHEYSHSANMSTLDPRPQLFNPQDLPPSFGHDYANEGPGGAGVLYPENASALSCGQGPRRVLLDPETGKYFYIEVPMQPLRKMLFDPELGQYVEVLIPQQAMSHSGLYPPAAPPYSSLHSSGLYAPQYLPYAVPSYPAISGSASQVRHPEPPPVPTTLHQTSLRYGSPASQMPKNEPKGHQSLDQSYLEGMYYIPTGMNASPNATPSECYHKPSSMPPSGGRRA